MQVCCLFDVFGMCVLNSYCKLLQMGGTADCSLPLFYHHPVSAADGVSGIHVRSKFRSGDQGNRVVCTTRIQHHG